MLSNKELEGTGRGPQNPEKHDSIPGKLRTNSTPALEPFSPGCPDFCFHTHTHRRHAHTHVRTAAENSAATTPRWGTGGRIYDGARNREGNGHATISRRERDTARRVNRAARRPDYDWLLFGAARTRNSAQCNRTDHAVTSTTCLHYHRGPCTDVNLRHPVTPTLRASRWSGENFWIYANITKRTFCPGTRNFILKSWINF